MDLKQPILSEAGSETHPQKSRRSALRCVLGALLTFGLGTLLITYALYIPTRQKLDKANADLENANAMISDDDDQITTLQTGSEGSL